MNPDFPKDERTNIEASLTALLLGELPHEQAAALHQKLAQDAELAKLYDRLRHTINLVRETVVNPAAETAAQPGPLRLAEERRQKLFQHFKTVAPKEFARPRQSALRWLAPVAAAAALIAILAALVLPVMRSAKMRSSSLGLPQVSTESSEIVDELAASKRRRAQPSDARTKYDEGFAEKNLKERFASEERGRKAITPVPPRAEMAPAAAGTTIVLPKATEVADVSQMGLANGPVGSFPAEHPKDFFDRSWDRAGVGRVNGGSGEPHPSARRGAAPTDASYEQATPARFGLSRDQGVSPPHQAPSPDLESYAKRSSNLGPEGQPLPAPPRNEYFAWSQDSTAPLSPPQVTTEPASPAAVATPAPASVEATFPDRLMRAVPPQAHARGEVVAQSVAAGRSSRLSRQPTDVRKGAALLLGSAATESARTHPSASYSGGAAYRGYSAIRQGPHGGPAAEAKPASSGAPETAVNEAGYRQEDRVTSRFSSHGSDQKALGFDWYLGNQLANGALPSARGGTAPPVASPAPALAQGGNVPALGDMPVAGQLFRLKGDDVAGRRRVAPGGSTSPSAAGEQKGIALSLKPQVNYSALSPGAPAAGVTESQAHVKERITGGAIQLKAEEKAKSAELAYKVGREIEERGTRESGASHNLSPGTNFYKVDVVGYVNVPVEARKPLTVFPLQSSDGETKLALKDSDASGDKSRQLIDARRRLDELQRQTQAPESRTAVEGRDADLPTTNVVTDVTPAKPAAPAPIPQPEVQTADNAFSTFSLNVSDVSFKVAAASLEKGVMPEPANVRSEEFLNAFDYRDPEPPPGVPIGFAWERAQNPFAQNRDLLRFSIKTAARGRQPGRPLNLVLLLDNSGSMERADRVRIIHEALRVLAGQLQPQDKLSVVTFSRTAHLWVDGVPGSQAARVVEEVSGLTPQGGTNLEDAMNLAYQTALRHYLANGINRVELLTDGAANLGNVDPEALKQKVEAHRKQGIALDCFGIGWEGYNDDLLEVLSRNGDGRYGFINAPEEAATEFAGQLAGALHVAASDVKVQVEFNPARVTAYRQIGYAKHQLTKEQFRDNTVDAAEIGAAESGNALYVIAVNPAGNGPLAIVRVRYKVPGTMDYREHEWPVPYAGNGVPLDQASPAMRLAAAASAFSEWLASSPYASEVNLDQLLGYLRGVPEVYGADTRPKKLEWMIRQAKNIAGK